MGKALENPPPDNTAASPPPETTPASPPPPVFEEKLLTVTIMLERSLGFSQELEVKKGSKIIELKQLLADGDPTKSTQPEDFSLAHPSAPGVALPDSTPITEEHLNLDLIT